MEVNKFTRICIPFSLMVCCVLHMAAENERNGLLHQGGIYVEENILHMIKWEVRRRIEGND